MGLAVLGWGCPWRDREGEEILEPQHILSHILAYAWSVLREGACSNLETYLLIT